MRPTNKHQRFLLGRKKILRNIREAHHLGGYRYKTWRTNNPHYIRYSYNDTYGKRLSNKKVRRADLVPQYGGYRKIFDYHWWCI